MNWWELLLVIVGAIFVIGYSVVGVILLLIIIKDKKDKRDISEYESENSSK